MMVIASLTVDMNVSILEDSGGQRLEISMDELQSVDNITSNNNNEACLSITYNHYLRLIQKI